MRPSPWWFSTYIANSLSRTRNVGAPQAIFSVVSGSARQIARARSKCLGIRRVATGLASEATTGRCAAARRSRFARRDRDAPQHDRGRQHEHGRDEHPERDELQGAVHEVVGDADVIVREPERAVLLVLRALRGTVDE